MAKRFTDTEKWKHAWFRKLPSKLKCAWVYLCDQCDHAGTWNIDIEALAFNAGDPISLDEILSFLPVDLYQEDKLIVRGFIEFQYGCSAENLNSDNRVHLSVIKRLRALCLIKPLASPMLAPPEKKEGVSTKKEGAKDKDKDKDMDMDKEKDKDRDKKKDKESSEKTFMHGRLRVTTASGVDPHEDFTIMTEAREAISKLMAEADIPF